ncbi:MAG: hypothetical protein H7Y42_06830 [Chitinophagaceae bacterium]|nr:hypothetical protein [Chitinophagaceae bacterium]
MTKNSCAVLVPSYDSYADLWKPFFNLLAKYWSDCPYPVYLGANKLSLDKEGVQMLHTDKGSDWTGGIIEMMQRIDAEYIILILEDFFLQNKISQSDVSYCLDFLARNNGHCIRMIQMPGPTGKIPGEKMVGEIAVGTTYRVSTQVAIWKKSSLLDLMRAGESIWQFEKEGTKRSETLHPTGYFGTRKDVMTYKHHVVQKGKWFPWEAKKFGQMDIGCDFTKRQIMTPTEAFAWRKTKFISFIFRLIPAGLRKKIGGDIAELPNIK